jgi:hypothetical protein
MCRFVTMEDMTESKAIEFVQGIMFNNANNLYNLGIPAQILNVTFHDYKESGKYSLTDRTKNPRITPYWARELGVRGVSYVAVQWVTYMGEIRARFLPVAEFIRLMNNEKRLGISRGNTGTLQNDFVTSVVNTTGQIYIEPDLKSLKVAAPTRWPDPREPQQTRNVTLATVGEFHVWICKDTLLFARLIQQNRIEPTLTCGRLCQVGRMKAANPPQNAQSTHFSGT